MFEFYEAFIGRRTFHISVLTGTLSSNSVSYPAVLIQRGDYRMTAVLKRSTFRCALLVLLVVVGSLAFAEDHPIRVGGAVAQANRISWVDPVYPAEAKQGRIQGKVSLEITIDKEG